MIKLTRLNNEEFVLNSDLIESLDANPDTILTLTTGQRMRVHESAEEVVSRIIDFRRAISIPWKGPSFVEEER